MSTRKKTPTEVETQILISSGRRCCICFGINGDSSQKKGQIAHLDQDPSNSDIDNLAYLCLDHHDDYDGKTRQSKGLTINEVKTYRKMLYDRVKLMRDSNSNNEPTKTTNATNATIDRIRAITNKFFKEEDKLLKNVDFIIFQKRLKAVKGSGNSCLSHPSGFVPLLGLLTPQQVVDGTL